MKILVYDVAASSRGALSVLTDFYQQVTEYGNEAEWHFVVSVPQLQETENVYVHRYPWIKNSPINRVIFDTFVIQKLIKTLKIDKVISLQNVCVFGCRVPQMISLHNALPFHKCNKKVLCGAIKIIKQKYLNYRVLNSLKKAERIFVPNDWIYSSCVSVKGVVAEKVRMVKPIMELSVTTAQNTGLDGEKIRFFYPANTEPYKRHDLLYKACKKIEPNKYELILTALGDENSYIIDLKNKIEKDKLPIHFKGNMNRNEVFNYYSNSVLVFPSEIETDALPIIEAMLCNAFIIATKSEFAECILKNYPNSIIVPLGDDEAFGNAMQSVIDHKHSIVKCDAREITATGEKGALVKAVIEG